MGNFFSAPKNKNTKYRENAESIIDTIFEATEEDRQDIINDVINSGSNLSKICTIKLKAYLSQLKGAQASVVDKNEMMSLSRAMQLVKTTLDRFAEDSNNIKNFN